MTALMQHLHAVTLGSALHVGSMQPLHAAGATMHELHQADERTVADGQDMQDLHEAPAEAAP